MLEGIGIIEKKSKNNIKWKIDFSGAGSTEVELAALRNEQTALRNEEAQIDAQILAMQNRLRELASGEQSAEHAYVTHADIKSIPELAGETLIAIKAPSGTDLEVPHPEDALYDGQRRYQIFLKSPSGPITCSRIA